jgi:hypothetical protein
MIASASTNFTYWHAAPDQSAREADILASVSVAIDILKSILPFCIAWAWASRKRGYVIVGSALFALFFSFSLMSAMGFAARNRGTINGGREAQAMRLERATAELQQAQAQLTPLLGGRVAAVIEQELSGMRRDRFWNGSQGCSDPSGGAARSFCKRYADRLTEFTAANSAEKLKSRIAELGRDVVELKSHGAGNTKDPQVLMFALVSGLDNEGAKIAISVFMAVLVELGAAFGLFLALGHSFNHVPGDGPPKDKKPDLPLLPPPAADKPEGPVKPLKLKFTPDGDLTLDNGESE